MQAVVVAVRHVTQRDAIERKTHLVLAETTHHDASRPFIGAVWIGRLKIYTRQFFYRLQGTCASRVLFKLGRSETLHLPGFTLAKHADFFNAGSSCALCRYIGVSCNQ